MRVGDVRNLAFENGSIGAYISLGVAEHFWEGMDAILLEAKRVLSDDGVLIVSVPHFSPKFKSLAERRFQQMTQKTLPNGTSFYQFYFTTSEFEKQLQEFGFKPVDVFYYAGIYGAKRSSPDYS